MGRRETPRFRWGWGGSPSKSKVKRRMRVRLSAGGAGSRPASLSFASRKLSIGFADATSGTAGRRTGWNDQNSRAWVDAEAAWGQSAPEAIHCSRAAISSFDSGSLGGILKSLRVRRTALRSKLCSGSPGTSAGPREPPF